MSSYLTAVRDLTDNPPVDVPSPASAPTLRQDTGATRHLDALDGVRAICVLMVMFSHAGLANLVPGGLGVAIFFVISGFLIGRQLILEAERTGSVRLRGFYMRRVFRLAPALLVFLAISVPVGNWLGARMAGLDVASALFYFTNYLYTYLPPHTDNPLTTLWSLSVEEHYYLVFPLIVLLFGRRPRALLLPICIAIAAALLWRLALSRACVGGPSMSYGLCGVPWQPGVPENRRIYFGTDTRFDSILTGALLALIVQYRPKWLRRLLHPAAFWGCFALLFASLLYRNPMFRDTFRYTLQNFAIAVLLASLVVGAPRFGSSLLSWRPAIYIGRLSYSLYIWHWGVASIIALLGGVLYPTRPEFIVFFIASFLLAGLSYHFVERPMINLRRRFGSHAPG